MHGATMRITLHHSHFRSSDTLYITIVNVSHFIMIQIHGCVRIPDNGWWSPKYVGGNNKLHCYVFCMCVCWVYKQEK